VARPGERARGLSAAELAAAVAELQALVGSVVLDVVPLQAPADDLLLVLQHGPDGRKVFVHVAPGGPRARVCTTARRWPKDAFARGATRDLLQRELGGATLHHVVQPDGERACAFGFRTAAGDRRLAVELYGARGLWALLDAESRVLQLSREVATAVRTLRPGDRYAPPAAAGDARAEPPMRFQAPVLAAIDAHFTALDERDDAVREHELLQRAASRALTKANARAEGLGQQLADAGRAAALREMADMMLAYAHSVARGAAAMTFYDPASGEPRTIELDPSKPVVVQAQALYEKARRLEDGRAIAEQRLTEARAAAAELQPIVAALAALAPDAADAAAQLAPLRDQLQRLGALPAAKPAATPKVRDRAAERGENFRKFVSAEGYTILVGRNNEQNDQLTMRFANGNDLWLHVGGGRPGSHVVVRLPKEKTASLETLLDAATLAVHFSKARGERRIEVVYTHKKHVKKPKGLPAGAVVPSQTRAVTVQLDEARLKRLLDSSADAE
jgi:predicted ribosome quality control (RQC) complex YloA/Tae2 family protein